MLRNHQCVCPSSELEQAIEQMIMHRTWGRVHRLKVDVDDHRVVVSGCTSCYYVKQLALEGILDVLGDDGSSQLELEIEVAAGPSRSRKSRGQDEPSMRALETKC
jgi:hypothetical protein